MSPVGTVGAPPATWDTLSEEEQIDLHVAARVPMFGVELRVIDDYGNVLAARRQELGAAADARPRRGAPLFQAGPGLRRRGQLVRHRRHRRDSPGQPLQITDRAKDVIKSGGEWISSIEIENAAVGCPGVAEAAAIGVPHPKWDERPLLLVVRDPGSTVGEGEIRAFLAGQMAKWWMPDAIEFVDELPHTASGKLSKKALRDQYRDYRFADAEAMVGRD